MIICQPLPHRPSISWCRVPGVEIARPGERVHPANQCRACQREMRRAR